jgi:CheY-like chemotaxis protein
MILIISAGSPRIVGIKSIREAMTQVLLITDTERVQRVFESLQGRGVLQLRTAPTLVKGDEEISAATPDYLFLQSRVSGFSGEIAARHLQKSLSTRTKIILLTVDDEDAAQARKHGKPYLSLALEDRELAEGVAAMLQGLPAPKKVPTTPAPPAEPAVAPPASVPTAAPKPRGVNGQAVAWLPPTIGQEPELEPEKTALPPPPSIEVEEVVVLSPPLPEQQRELLHPEAQLEHEEPPSLGEPAAEENGGTRSFADLIEEASAKEPAPLSKTPEAEQGIDAGAAASFVGKNEPELFPRRSVETVADRIDAEEFAALHRKEKKHKRWVIPVALALAFIPLIYFVVVSQTARKPAGVRAQAPVAAPKAARPAPVAAATAAKPAPAAVPKLPAPSAPPKAGLKALPPLLAGVRVDPAYSKEHPGWQRFIGSRAEYRLFKQGDLYRAMQVLAQKRQSIPEELFKKVLLEFGGAQSYLLESREKKGPYLIERGAAKGNLALTIYRNNKDLAVKGLVLYYR